LDFGKHRIPIPRLTETGRPFIRLPALRQLESKAMAFNHELAADILDDHDRDQARFFAGREREIQAFDRAARQASRYENAVFRVFQGAPGCGKTSLASRLAERLAEKRAGKTVFFKPTDANMRSVEALLLSIRGQATQGSRTHQAASRAAALATEGVKSSLLDLSVIREQVQDFIDHLATSKRRIVLHIDEAHSIPDSYDRTLNALHARGLNPNGPGIPCVVVLTGLGHTEERVSGILGLSRLAEDATLEMGGMSAKECIESTLMMLDALCPEGSRKECEKAARLAASLSHGWPQHLNRAQRALCEELARKGGQLDRVDEKKIKARADAMRAEYYDRRMKQPPLSYEPELSRRILVDIWQQQLPESRARLDKLCGDAIARYGRETQLPTEHLRKDELAGALIEKGIVSSNSGYWALAIPSMADWARQAL